MVVGSLTVETDVVVIGAGPGGYVAAIRAAQLGKDVILIEKEKKLGGICLNVGCIPTKALITSSDYFNVIKDLETMGINVKDVNVDLEKMNLWKDSIIAKLEMGIRTLCEKHSIEIIEGVAKFKDKNTLSISGQSDVETIKFKNAIIATGSSPIEVEEFPFDGKHIISSNEGISLQEVPKRLLIIGGGYIGTELGTVYGKLGSEVHIFERHNKIIGALDQEIVKVVLDDICKFNVNVHFHTQSSGHRIENNKVIVDFKEGEENKTLDFDKVMVVVGRKPNSNNLGLEELGVKISEKGFIEVDSQMKSSVENILAIGDVVGQPMLAHKASREGKVAAEVCADKPSAFDNKAIPLVVFNDPELMSVGLTLDQAKEKGYNANEKKFPFAALGKAYIFDRTHGFIKMTYCKDSNLVLGVHAVGPHVTEIVSEAALAIEMGATVEDMSLTIHPHPTISESMAEVADATVNAAIHIYQPKEKE